MRPGGKTVDSKVLADVIKKDVARFDNGAMDRYRTVSLLAPAPVFTPAEIHTAGTVVGSFRIERVVR